MFVVVENQLQILLFQFIAVNVFWAAVHYLIWDGKASTKEDVIASILSPGSFHDISRVVFILLYAFFFLQFSFFQPYNPTCK